MPMPEWNRGNLGWATNGIDPMILMQLMSIPTESAPERLAINHIAFIIFLKYLANMQAVIPNSITMNLLPIHSRPIAKVLSMDAYPMPGT